MNSNLVLKIIGNMQSGISITDFQKNMNSSKSVSNDVINFLINNGYVSKEDQQLFFSRTAKIELTIFAIKMGCDIQKIANLLDWKDFENFLSLLLTFFGFSVKSNIVLTKPRKQIDVIGIKKDFALIADCKHWKLISPSMLYLFVEEQIKRSRLFLTRNPHISSALPIIVTLNSNVVNKASNIPIIPIIQLKSFLENYELYLDKFDILRNNTI